MLSLETFQATENSTHPEHIDNFPNKSDITVVADAAARISEINRLKWEDLCWDIDGEGNAAICLWTRNKRGAVRTPHWVPVIERVKETLQYTYQHRTKNSPWVFTNPKMVVKYPDNPNRWRWIYRDKFFATFCDSNCDPEVAILQNVHE